MTLQYRLQSDGGAFVADTGKWKTFSETRAIIIFQCEGEIFYSEL